LALLNFLKGKRKREVPKDREQQNDRGFLVFENTSEVIQAENLLKQHDWEIRVMGPPPEIRQGCDLVIEFPLIKELQILRVLEMEKLPPLKVVPVTSPLLQPVDIFHIKDYGRYLMVRAANMKLTVDRETAMIVNISEVDVRMFPSWPLPWWDNPLQTHQVPGKSVIHSAVMPCSLPMRRFNADALCSGDRTDGRFSGRCRRSHPQRKSALHWDFNRSRQQGDSRSAGGSGDSGGRSEATGALCLSGRRHGNRKRK
jgi:hypothetical protein